MSHDEYWYKEGLASLIPPMVAACPAEFLKHLMQWLDASIFDEHHPNAEHDWSEMWRPAIEEHSQNNSSGLPTILVGLVRDTCELAIKDHKLSLKQILDQIAQHRYLAYGRLTLHLANTFAEEDHALAAAKMLDQSLFDDYCYKHEYAMLVGSRFTILTPEQQQTWLGWVEHGPDLSNFEHRTRA